MISGNRRIPLVYSSKKEKEPIFYKYSPVIQKLLKITKGQTVTPASTGLEPYDWMLIDNTNEVWVADNNLSNLRSTGTTIPIGSNYWGYGYSMYQKCLWTGTYWMFGNRNTTQILRSDVNLKTWEISSGVNITTDGYDITTNGSNTVVVTNFGKFSYISTDNGLTWSSKTLFLNGYHIKTYYDNLIWIITQTSASSGDKYILVSTNNGQTFSTINTSQVLAICKNPSTNTFVGIGRSNAFFSTDGTTWISRSITGVTNDLVGEILFDGTKYVGVGLYDGPIWSNDAISWNKWTSNDGSILYGVDYDYNRLHFNGTIYTYRNGVNNKLYKSLDGKIWSAFAHPVSGRWFIDSYPKVQDVNLNLK